MSHTANVVDTLPSRQGRSLQQLLRIETRQQLAFWILFAGLACIIVFVRVGVVYRFHPLFIAYMWVVAMLILCRYLFFAIYDPPFWRLENMSQR